MPCFVFFLIKQFVRGFLPVRERLSLRCYGYVQTQEQTAFEAYIESVKIVWGQSKNSE